MLRAGMGKGKTPVTRYAPATLFQKEGLGAA